MLKTKSLFPYSNANSINIWTSNAVLVFSSDQRPYLLQHSTISLNRGFYCLTLCCIRSPTIDSLWSPSICATEKLLIEAICYYFQAWKRKLPVAEQ